MGSINSKALEASYLFSLRLSKGPAEDCRTTDRLQMFLDGLRKVTEDASQNIRTSDVVLNPVPPDYEATVTIIRAPQRSIMDLGVSPILCLKHRGYTVFRKWHIVYRYIIRNSCWISFSTWIRTKIAICEISCNAEEFSSIRSPIRGLTPSEM
jgi:hypothetical protein